MLSSTNRKWIQGKETSATTIPLVTPPSEIATFISPADMGGMRISTIFPWIFDISKDEDVWLKACCRIDIIIKPGAKNSINGTPLISGLKLPKAKVKLP